MSSFSLALLCGWENTFQYLFIFSPNRASERIVGTNMKSAEVLPSIYLQQCTGCFHPYVQQCTGCTTNTMYTVQYTKERARKIDDIFLFLYRLILTLCWRAGFKSFTKNKYISPKSRKVCTVLFTLYLSFLSLSLFLPVSPPPLLGCLKGGRRLLTPFHKY